MNAAFDMGLIKAKWLRGIVEACEGWLMRCFDRVSSISGQMLKLAHAKGVDPQKIVETWFIYCGLRREVIKDIDTSISIVHEALWFKYKDLMEKLNSSTCSSEVLLDNIIRIIKSLDGNISILAFDNLTSCFSLDSSEYKYLIKD